MKYFYHYIVEYWDQLDEKMRTDHGFMREDSYANAVQEISKWYGEDQIESLNISILEDGDGPLTVSMIIDTLGRDIAKYE